MANPLPQITLLDLLSPNGQNQRLFHAVNGTLGQLLTNIEGPISRPKDADFWFVKNAEGQREVYDTSISQWVLLTDELLESIPKTYSFVPRPENAEIGLDYFVRGSGLLKHSFV